MLRLSKVEGFFKGEDFARGWFVTNIATPLSIKGIKQAKTRPINFLIEFNKI